MISNREVNDFIQKTIVHILRNNNFLPTKRKIDKFTKQNFYREYKNCFNYIGIQISKYGNAIRFEAGIHPKWVKKDWTFPYLLKTKYSNLTAYECEIFLRKPFPQDFVEYSKYDKNKFYEILQNEIQNIFEWFNEYSSVRGVIRLSKSQIKAWKDSIRANFLLSVSYIEQENFNKAKDLIEHMENIIKTSDKPLDASIKKYPSILRKLIDDKKLRKKCF